MHYIMLHFSSRDNFRYPYCVTTYLIFQRERRAMCARFRAKFKKFVYNNFTFKSSFIKSYIKLFSVIINLNCNPSSPFYKLHLDLTYKIIIIFVANFFIFKSYLTTTVYILITKKGQVYRGLSITRQVPLNSLKHRQAL